MSTTVSTVAAETKPGIRHVLDNVKYPDYIRNHKVFHTQSKIKKVFPSIGLPNVVEECEYNCIADARLDAQHLLFTDIRGALSRGADNAYSNVAVQNLLYEVLNVVSNWYPNMILTEEGRVALKFVNDCGSYEGKPFVRKGEGVFKAYGKLSEKLKQVCGFELAALDSMPHFKAFSSSNIPAGKKFKLAFASAGEEGAWDIATISMRGIASCQTWGTPQSRGLIGSISSKYVGVVYITNGEKFNEYGSKMIRRSMVRFCINAKTKKPGLLLDRVYPAHDGPTVELFRKFLHKRTGLPVLFSTEPGWHDYQLPAETSTWKVAPFEVGDFTYMDTKIPWIKPAAAKTDPQTYYNAIANLDNRLIQAVHNNIIKKLDEYCVDKKEHRDLFKGGVGNLIVSLKKHVGCNTFSTYTLLPRIYSHITIERWFPSTDKYDSIHEYERAVIRHAFLHMRDLEKHSHDNGARSLHKVLKFYPKSFEKYYAFMMDEYKKELVKAYKNLLQA
jgi:hypothetical protein